MAERRFTELQRRLTIASFLRSLKKKKNRKNNIPKEDVSHISFVRAASFCYIFLYITTRCLEKKIFFLTHSVRQDCIFIAEVSFFAEEKRKISTKKKENVGAAQDNGFSVRRKIRFFGHLMHVTRVRARVCFFL